MAHFAAVERAAQASKRLVTLVSACVRVVVGLIVMVCAQTFIMIQITAQPVGMWYVIQCCLHILNLLKSLLTLREVPK